MSRLYAPAVWNKLDRYVTEICGAPGVHHAWAKWHRETGHTLEVESTFATRAVRYWVCARLAWAGRVRRD